MSPTSGFSKSQRFCSLLIAAAGFAGLIGCVASPEDGSALSSKSSHGPTAAELQGPPMMLAPSYKGRCTYRYQTGTTTDNCIAELTSANSLGEVSLVLNVSLDNAETSLTSGSYRIVGNQLESSTGAVVGQIGVAGLSMTAGNTQISLEQLGDQSVAVLVYDLPNIPGDHSKGPAFAAQVK